LFLSRNSFDVRLCQPIIGGRDLNCPLCRELEQAYEAALSEYIEACSSASFYVCSNLAARKNVDMERTKYELEEHSLVCTSASTTVAPLPERGMYTNLNYELETISDAVSA